MTIIKSTFSGPGITHTWDELPEEAKAALKDRQVGETASFVIDDEKYKLTLVERREISADDYDRFVSGDAA